VEDPYAILGVTRDADHQTVRERWLYLVRENHPDAASGSGYPEEEVELLTARLARINAAYTVIKQKLSPRKDWY
jgi:DnaJ like chaperone protein